MAEPTMLEQLLQAMEDAKAVIRQAHEATRDLRQAMKEAREIGRELQRDEFEPYLRAEVERTVGALAEVTERSVTANSERVIRRFDKLANLLMYGNEQGRGESLEPQILKVARERHSNGDGS